jgi:flavin reductase (DIM6/NTAB) family NADH-FMN oxidoreductase RutF
MSAIEHEATLDPGAKKTVLRMVSYGLYAVGVARGEERNMFTANWLSQVSFEPPLVALSVENDGHSIELIRQSGAFAVTVFGDEQRDRAAALGKPWRLNPDKIREVPTRGGITGCPILEDGVGAVECRVVDSMAAGDSTVFLGEVISAEVLREGTPLTMAAAGFRHAG